MKILQLTTFFHPVVGGVEIHVKHLSEQLVKNGYEVEILASDSNKDKGRIKESYEKVSGIAVRRFRTLFSLSYFHKVFPGVFLYLMKADYDLIHVHGLRKTESYLALLAAKLRKKKIILTTHNPIPVSSRSNTLENFVKLHDKTFGKWFLKKFDKVIALVKSEKEVLQQIFKVPAEKITVVPNGVDESYFEDLEDKVNLKNEWGIDKSKWDGIVLGIGRINEVKGYQNLDLAVRKLKRVLFVFAGGDDGYLPKLEKIYRDAKNVFFTKSFVSQDRLHAFYNAADIFVLPSLHEAFGIVLIEAMAKRVPVLATNQGGPADFIKPEFGVLIDPLDKEGWKKAIEEIITNPKLKKSMSENAVKAAQKYNWKKVVQKIIKSYEEAFAGTGNKETTK